MPDALIYDAVRTPRGKGRPDGALHDIAPVDLVAGLVGPVLERTGLSPGAVGDLVLGCVTQQGDQGANIAKYAAERSGLGVGVPAMTLNRYCTSGLDACNVAAMKVMAGIDGVVLAGGVESMSRVPMLADRATFYNDPSFLPMGVAADIIAARYGFSREDCDRYAVESHRRAARARDEGRFDRSLVPVVAADGTLALAQDEIVRADTTVERLAGFEPSFGAKGVHHKGNSPGIVDGASLVVIGSDGALTSSPRARIVAMKNACGDPELGLTGGIDATAAVLAAAGMSASDVDLFEFNESFASTSLLFPQELDLDPELVNPNGGALAMGHAMGATGASLLGTVLDELERRDRSVGLIAVSGAAGIGTATIIERL